MILKREMHKIEGLYGVRDTRVFGAIGVVEMDFPVNVARLQKFFVEKGVWIRPFSNLIYIMPPYIISEEELIILVDSMYEAIIKKVF